MRLGAGIAVVGPVINFALARDAFQRKGFGNNAPDLGMGISIAFVVVLTAMGAAVWLWMAWANGKGLDWARLLSTAFAGLAVVSWATTFVWRFDSGRSDAAIAVGYLLGFASLATGFVALWFLWRPDASAYFKARSLGVPMR